MRAITLYSVKILLLLLLLLLSSVFEFVYNESEIMSAAALGFISDTLVIFEVGWRCGTGTGENHKEQSEGSQYLKQDLQDINNSASHSTTMSYVYLLYSDGLTQGYKTQVVRATKEYL
jgi:hypothetical protein